MYIDFDSYQNNLGQSKDLPKKLARFLNTYCGSRIHRAEGEFARYKGNSATLPTYFQFSHDLIKTGDHQWNILSDDSDFAPGSNSKTFNSNFRIVIQHKRKAIIESCNDLVKIQSALIPDDVDQQLQAQIAKHRYQHTPTIKLRWHDDTIYTVIANCGTKLDTIINSEIYARATMWERLEYINAICAKVLELKQFENSHGNLKAANICIKRNMDDELEVTLIEFADLDERNSQNDLYALADIIRQILGVMPSYKKPYADLLDSNSYPNNIFNRIPSNPYVDDELLIDLKSLLAAMQDESEDHRPTLEFVVLFLRAIPVRMQANEKFAVAWAPLKKASLELARLSEEVKDYIDANQVSLEKRQSLQNYLQEIRKIDEQRKLLYVPMRHYQVVTELQDNSLSVEQYRTHAYPTLDGLLDTINSCCKNLTVAYQEINRQHQFLELYRATEALINSDKFEDTNSSGMIRMQSILKSQLPPLTKLQKIREIAQQKTHPGISYLYSCSHLFGKGRHKNVDTLYRQLAALELPRHMHESANMTKGLAEVNGYIREHDFLHEKKTNCFGCFN